MASLLANGTRADAAVRVDGGGGGGDCLERTVTTVCVNGECTSEVHWDWVECDGGGGTGGAGGGGDTGGGDTGSGGGGTGGGGSDGDHDDDGCPDSCAQRTFEYMALSTTGCLDCNCAPAVNGECTVCVEVSDPCPQDDGSRDCCEIISCTTYQTETVCEDGSDGGFPDSSGYWQS